MLKKFFKVAISSFFIALTVSMTAAFLIQTFETNKSTDLKLESLLDDVSVLIAENDEQIKNIRKELDDSFLEKTRLFAEMLYLNPDLKQDYDRLCYIRDTMNVDELHVIDDDGILRYGTVEDYYNYDMASAAQSGEFIQIINDPSIELVQEPQPNGADAKLFQYVGVARKDAGGFVQIGMQPYRLEEAMDKAAPENILKQIKIDNSMRLLILSGGVVLGDSQNTLIGSEVPEIKTGSGNVNINGSCHYVAKASGDYLIAAIIDSGEMFSARNSSLLVFLVTNTLILSALVFAISFWLLVSIIKPLGKVSQNLEVIANGNLECRVDVRNTPEFTMLSDGINAMVSNIADMLGDSKRMTETLTDVIGSVESGAGGVDLSTQELFKESQGLSAGAKLQNETVEKMSRLLEEIHHNAVENAKRASDANDVSGSALKNANDGSDKMKEMINAVKEIDMASKDISKIMKTIDDIAFQTNILALNAAVEAARAGAHGKGFAVVAEEVRNLAGKSAEAAKQTEELINSSIQRSNTGVIIADETAGKISEIVDDIRRSASFTEDIVTSSEVQVQAVGQLNENMESIRNGVEMTIHSAERITQESEKLQLCSGEMNEVIGRIK